MIIFWPVMHNIIITTEGSLSDEQVLGKRTFERSEASNEDNNYDSTNERREDISGEFDESKYDDTNEFREDVDAGFDESE